MNRWKIPKWLEFEVRCRDKVCIYCGIEFGSALGVGSLASWEHIINDEKIITRENIAICCRSCNASKGTKPLSVWLTSTYCLRKEITSASVAEVVKNSLVE